MEGFKTFDREGQGFITAAEVRHVLTCLGETLCLQIVSDGSRKTNLDKKIRQTLPHTYV